MFSRKRKHRHINNEYVKYYTLGTQDRPRIECEPTFLTTIHPAFSLGRAVIIKNKRKTNMNNVAFALTTGLNGTR